MRRCCLWARERKWHYRVCICIMGGRPILYHPWSYDELHRAGRIDKRNGNDNRNCCAAIFADANRHEYDVSRHSFASDNLDMDL